MLWGSSEDAFWSKKLVDQDGTVFACMHVFIGGSHSALLSAVSLSVSLFVSSARLSIEKCWLPVTVTVLLLLISVWVDETAAVFLAHSPNTSASTHTHTHTTSSAPCRPSAVSHSSHAAMSSRLFWRENRLVHDSCSSSCSHSFITSVVVRLTSFHFRLLMAGAKWFDSHTLTIDTCEGEKKHLKHTTVCCWENHANFFFFSPWDFLVLIHSSLTQTRKSLSH